MLTRKLVAGLATAGLIASVMAPAAFAADIDISGNGNKSDNNVLVGSLNVNAVGQENNTTANTTVVNTANTGGNKANGNTGDGGVAIETGDATNSTMVTVTGGDNDATLPDPCGCQGVDSISITDNGNKSNNNVAVLSANINLVGQKSKTKANTTVVNTAKTGKNKANNNTGGGSVGVSTGAALNRTRVTVTGGSNTLN